MTIEAILRKEYEALSREATRLEKAIRKAPAGHLNFYRSGDTYKWVQVGSTKEDPDVRLHGRAPRKYIPKKNRPLAEALAMKLYNESRYEAVRDEMQALEAYLCRHRDVNADNIERLLDHPGYRELILPQLESQDYAEWAAEPFEENPLFPEKKNIRTLSGRMVRSKSEAMIDMQLTQYGIPFRYESPLLLPGLDTPIYPDFTIRHPSDGEFYYWEHLGMMDSPKYLDHNLLKLKEYTTTGILPFGHLILTFESADEPLDINLVNTLIHHYFLAG